MRRRASAAAAVGESLGVRLPPRVMLPSIHKLSFKDQHSCGLQVRRQ